MTKHTIFVFCSTHFFIVYIYITQIILHYITLHYILHYILFTYIRTTCAFRVIKLELELESEMLLRCMLGILLAS